MIARRTLQYLLPYVIKENIMSLSAIAAKPLHSRIRKWEYGPNYSAPVDLTVASKNSLRKSLLRAKDHFERISARSLDHMAIVLGSTAAAATLSGLGLWSVIPQSGHESADPTGVNTATEATQANIDINQAYGQEVVGIIGVRGRRVFTEVDTCNTAMTPAVIKDLPVALAQLAGHNIRFTLVPTCQGAEPSYVPTGKLGYNSHQ